MNHHETLIETITSEEKGKVLSFRSTDEQWIITSCDPVENVGIDGGKFNFSMILLLILALNY